MLLKIKRRSHQIIAIVIAAVVIITGLILLRARLVSPLQPATPGATAHTADTPSQQPITKANYVSTAVGDEPKYITLPTINAEGFIAKMGIDQYGAVAAPYNINLAGWYANSFKPGQAGLSIIDGHVDGVSAPGIFFHLAQLKAGDAFTVDLANGVTEHFRVKSVATVPDADATAAMFARDDTITSQLNLITCGGKFDRAAHQYVSRTIVVAALES